MAPNRYRAASSELLVDAYVLRYPMDEACNSSRIQWSLGDLNQLSPKFLVNFATIPSPSEVRSARNGINEQLMDAKGSEIFA